MPFAQEMAPLVATAEEMAAFGEGVTLSERTAPARPAFLSNFNDRLVPDLGSVEAPLSVRKPDDSLGDPFPISGAPQIELDDNGVERLNEDGGCCRFEGSAFV